MVTMFIGMLGMQAMFDNIWWMMEGRHCTDVYLLCGYYVVYVSRFKTSKKDGGMVTVLNISW